MTFSIVSPKEVPQILNHYEDVVLSHSLIENNVALLELYINKLSQQREHLLKQRTMLVQQVQHYQMMSSSVGRIPMESVAPYLMATEICTLSSVSRHFYQQCVPGGQLLLAHFVTPRCELSPRKVSAIVDSLCLSMIESIFIDAKRPSGKLFIREFASRGHHFQSLKSFRVSAAAEAGNFVTSIETFMSLLPRNQITSIHLSGFRAIKNIATIIASQAASIERFQVDYFVNGHEKDITPTFLPEMPKLRSLIYDVADVTDVPVELIISRLSAIERKDLVEAIYLPHMQISGESYRISEMVDLLKEFDAVNQLVVRFRHLPLSVKDIVSFRECFHSLPAVCISDHFVVCQATWCSWWPTLTEVWDRPEKITGLSVFREQIDFEALGTSGNRQWLKLSREQKSIWSEKIAPKVRELYLQQRRNSSVRAASV